MNLRSFLVEIEISAVLNCTFVLKALCCKEMFFIETEILK